MMDHIWINRFKFFIFLLATSIFLSNCAFYSLKKEVAEIEKVNVLSGKVINDISHRGPVIVILYSGKGAKKEIVEYTLPEDTGDFSFLVTEGAYYLAAFEDINNNFKYDDKEFFGYFGNPDQIIVSVKESASSDESKEMSDLEIQLLKTDGANSSFPMALETEALSGRNFRKIGQLTDLDDKIFMQENGSTGYWKPLTFLMKNVFEDGQDYIKLFVSISTPWNGHRAASSGVERAPAVIPSWYDMVPDSDFIQSIYQKEFPSDIRFCLLFSFRGGCRMNMGNNDGAVELASVLDSRAQKDADTIIGFDEDHVSILSSQEVIVRYYEILNSLTRSRGMDIRDYGVMAR